MCESKSVRNNGSGSIAYTCARPVSVWEGDADTQLPAFLASIYEGVHLFQGVTDSTMSHGEGWHFIQMGRYLERASATSNSWRSTTKSSGRGPRSQGMSFSSGSDCCGPARPLKRIAKSIRPI